MSKQFLGVIAIVILIFVGIFALTGNKSKRLVAAASNSSALSQHVEARVKKYHSGEYGDYECPFCGQYFPIVSKSRLNLTVRSSSSSATSRW